MLKVFMGSRGRSSRKQAARRGIVPEMMELEERKVLTLLGQELFPADNPWNQVIANAPVAANSSAIMKNIITKYGDGDLHPDFMEDFGTRRMMYGMPYNIVRGNSTPKVKVIIDNYKSESDLFDVPIPPNAVLQGDWQDGPMEGFENRHDSHLIVWDADNNIAYELYRVSRPSENADGQWHAFSETVWDMKDNVFRPLGWTSGDAAGLSILAGLVRPDEGLPVSQGGQGVIDHAIRFTLTNSLVLNKYQYPASHNANPGNKNDAVMPPMGARFRLKAGVDISKLNPQSKIIAQAMKTYGMILADNGGNFFFSGSNYSVDINNNKTLTWDNEDIQDRSRGLKSLDFSDFEIVDLKPAVTALSSTSGVAGSVLTITGRNFSGAAGRLQVFFGTEPATSVTYIDDSHIKVIVPAGVGVVDVRVQSGVAASTANNYTNPVFGYGISDIVPADRFTYSGTAASRSTATFVGSNSTSKGNWKGLYGSDGASVIGDWANLPSYATVTATGQNPYFWSTSTQDARALQKPAANSTDRVAAAWFGSQFTVDVKITDGRSHKMTLYAADFDTVDRKQRIDLLDAATNTVLDSRTMSSFQNGQYLTWDVKGHVKIRVTLLSGRNALLSGLFFGDTPSTSSAAFIGSDKATQGNWKATYGADGAHVIGDQVAYPAYASVVATDATPFMWTSSTKDVRGLLKQASGSNDRVAAAWYGSKFAVELNFTDGLAHNVTIYAADMDTTERVQRVDVVDAASGKLLDSRTMSSFQNGQYLTWSLKGRVQLRFTSLEGRNALLTGLFFGNSPGNSASFVGADATTQGNWKGKYGAGGSTIVGDSATYPANASVTMTGLLPFYWALNTTDLRGLQKGVAGSTSRIASAVYGSQFTVDVNLTDGRAHKLSIYAADWDLAGRSQRVEVIDAATGKVLDTRTMSSFQNGQYLSWTVKGRVKLRITNLTGRNAVLAGLFID